MKLTAPLIALLVVLAFVIPASAAGDVTNVTESTKTVLPTTHTITPEPTKEKTREPTKVLTVEPTKEPVTAVTTGTGPQIGWVTFTSTPSGATITLDSRVVGITPAMGKELGAEISHSVKISIEGYEPYESTVTVKSGEQAAVDATLKAVPAPTQKPTPVPTTRQPIGSGKGWIRVNANVDGATVSFDQLSSGCTVAQGYCDTEVGTTSSPFKTFTVQKPGYNIYTGQVTSWPKQGETVDLYATLNPVQSTGAITVTSYPSGAVATLDGGTWQYTPCTFPAVTSGTNHIVQLSLSGYQTYSTTVYVASGETQPVTVTMIANPLVTGSIGISTNPAGADIYIDGQYRGPSPSVVPGLVPGTHTLRLQKAGYDEYVNRVTINAGQRTPITITFSPLPADVGSIELTSTPAGASVFLDGSYMGLTPPGDYLDLTSITPGSHTITLRLTDYQDYTRTVMVSAGGIVTINAQISPVIPGPAPDTTGQIVVSSDPAGAEVFLDNLFIGTTPLTRSDVPAGQHMVMFKQAGYATVSNDVTVSGGEATPVSVLLAEVTPTATKSPVSPVVVLGALGFIGAVALLRRK